MMRHMKKIASLVLALVMVMTMAMPVFATNVDNVNAGDNVKGTITIDNAVVGQTYSIYQIFSLESYNKTNNTYAYKIVDAWKGFFEGEEAGKGFVTIDGQGYIEWKAAAGTDMVAFAKAALAYAQKNNISATASDTATSDVEDAETTTVVFEGLSLGYYLLDSTVGTLCSLNTTDNTVTIQDKNEKPTTDKKVEEDSTGEYGTDNDANIGQTVNYQTTITAQAGAKNYILHDKMTGLNFTSVTSITLDDKEVDANYYTVKTGNLEDNCTFEVVFTQEFCDTLTAGSKIVVSYSAVVNENAVIAGAGNPNETHLSYGDNNDNETETSETRTYTFGFDLVKITEGKVLLTGAEFELYGSEKGTDKIALVEKSNGVYRVATDEEKNADGFASAIIKAGKVTIEGLDGGTTYWLEETKAPDGYNKLEGRVKVELSEKDVTVPNDASVTVNNNLTSATMNGNNYVKNGVAVENKTGSLLPSTGGIGTTIFYVIGGILVIGAGVLLITKKRMSREV